MDAQNHTEKNQEDFSLTPPLLPKPDNKRPLSPVVDIRRRSKENKPFKTKDPDGKSKSKDDQPSRTSGSSGRRHSSRQRSSSRHRTLDRQSSRKEKIVELHVKSNENESSTEDDKRHAKKTDAGQKEYKKSRRSSTNRRSTDCADDKSELRKTRRNSTSRIRPDSVAENRECRKSRPNSKSRKSFEYATDLSKSERVQPSSTSRKSTEHDRNRTKRHKDSEEPDKCLHSTPTESSTDNYKIKIDGINQFTERKQNIR